MVSGISGKYGNVLNIWPCYIHRNKLDYINLDLNRE